MREYVISKNRCAAAATKGRKATAETNRTDARR